MPNGGLVGGLATLGAAIALVPALLETRIARSAQRPDESWKQLAVSDRGQTLLGISIRPRQVEAFGLDLRSTVETLVTYPFHIMRIAAYWNRVEPRKGVFETTELDVLLEAAERARKQVILSVGAVKNFGYPEFYVPAHYLESPLKEGALVRPSTHAALLAGATGFLRQVVGRYSNRSSVIAWQLEHEAVDPLGVEHSWRLSEEFIRAELETLREADPSRPVLMNGFLPTSSVVALSQWWRTRDQGDSLAVATRLAEVVGIDYYPRHALFSVGNRTLYLNGATLPWQRARTRSVLSAVEKQGKRVMVSEGQAEPWEAVTLPPNPERHVMYSCRPADVIRNYNATMGWGAGGQALDAYLFWGAEYWILRSKSGDPSYLLAFQRILDES